MQLYFSALGGLFPKSFLGAYFTNNCLWVRKVSGGKRDILG